MDTLHVLPDCLGGTVLILYILCLCGPTDPAASGYCIAWLGCYRWGASFGKVFINVKESTELSCHIISPILMQH
jgi:hypothetical protein